MPYLVTPPSSASRHGIVQAWRGLLCSSRLSPKFILVPNAEKEFAARSQGELVVVDALGTCFRRFVCERGWSTAFEATITWLEVNTVGLQVHAHKQVSTYRFDRRSSDTLSRRPEIARINLHYPDIAMHSYEMKCRTESMTYPLRNTHSLGIPPVGEERKKQKSLRVDQEKNSFSSLRTVGRPLLPTLRFP